MDGTRILSAMNLQKQLRTKHGFTLIEIMISLVLISTLLSFVIFAYREYTLQMQETAAKYEALMLLQTKSEEIQVYPNQIQEFISGETIRNNIPLQWSIEKKPYKNNATQAIITVIYKSRMNTAPEKIQTFIILPS